MDYPLPQPFLPSPPLPIPQSPFLRRETRRIDLNALIREATAIATPQWRTLDAIPPVRIAMNLQDPAEIEGHAEPLRAGLVELLLHCVGPVWDSGEIVIETRRESAYQKLVVTGCCRSEADSRAAFQKIFAIGKVEPDRHTHPIIREVVHGHAGVVALETDAEGRPAVTIRFPVSTKRRRFHLEGGPVEAPQKLRILMVDDDETILDIHSQILRREGYELVTCHDSVVALEYLASEPFAILLTDDVMPGIGGLQLAAAARAFAPDRPVVLVTGYASRLIPGENPPEHVDEVLAKPVTPYELRNAVARALGKSRLANVAS